MRAFSPQRKNTIPAIPHGTNHLSRERIDCVAQPGVKGWGSCDQNGTIQVVFSKYHTPKEPLALESLLKTISAAQDRSERLQPFDSGWATQAELRARKVCDTSLQENWTRVPTAKQIVLIVLLDAGRSNAENLGASFMNDSIGKCSARIGQLSSTTLNPSSLSCLFSGL
jgi:hypothetical protein